MTSLGGGDNSDPFMRELFAAEVDMHLPVLSEGLLALEKGRAGKEEIDSMMRAAHSIKGAARVVGIDRAVRVAHVMEDCFTAAKQGRITLTSDAVDTLLQGLDILQRICSPQPDAELDSALGERAIESLLTRVAAVTSGAAPPAPRGLATAEIRVALPGAIDDASAESLRSELARALDRAGGHGGGRERPRIVLDFGRVERLSVPHLALLLAFGRENESNAQPAAVQIEGVASPLRAVLRMVGIDDGLGAGAEPVHG